MGHRITATGCGVAATTAALAALAFAAPGARSQVASPAAAAASNAVSVEEARPRMERAHTRVREAIAGASRDGKCAHQMDAAARIVKSFEQQAEKSLADHARTNTPAPGSAYAGFARSYESVYKQFETFGCFRGAR